METQQTYLPLGTWLSGKWKGWLTVKKKRVHSSKQYQYEIVLLTTTLRQDLNDPLSIAILTHYPSGTLLEDRELSFESRIV